MALVCISFSQLDKSACLWADPFSWVMSLLWVFQKNALSIVTSCSTSSSQCCQVFCHATRCSKGSWKFTSVVKTTSVLVSFESVLHLHYLQHSRTLFQVSCRWCGIHHGPPSMTLFLSTSACHPGISLRINFSTLSSLFLNDRFSRSRHRFTSLTFDQEIQLSVRHQTIYSHIVYCMNS